MKRLMSIQSLPNHRDQGWNTYSYDITSINFFSDMGPLVRREDIKRMKFLLKDAISKGAKLEYGGKVPLKKVDNGNWFEPTNVTIANNHTFSGASIYNLKVWVENPNGNADCNNGNDTTLLENLVTPLNGVYTLGGVREGINQANAQLWGACQYPLRLFHA